MDSSVHPVSQQATPEPNGGAGACRGFYAELGVKNALEETAYLLRSPKNAKQLLESIAQLEAGGGTEKEPDD